MLRRNVRTANIRGAAMVEYALLLVCALLVVGAAAKMLGKKSASVPGRVAGLVQSAQS